MRETENHHALFVSRSVAMNCPEIFLRALAASSTETCSPDILLTSNANGKTFPWTMRKSGMSKGQNSTLTPSTSEVIISFL